MKNYYMKFFVQMLTFSILLSCDVALVPYQVSDGNFVDSYPARYNAVINITNTGEESINIGWAYDKDVLSTEDFYDEIEFVVAYENYPEWFKYALEENLQGDWNKEIASGKTEKVIINWSDSEGTKKECNVFLLISGGSFSTYLIEYSTDNYDYSSELKIKNKGEHYLNVSLDAYE